IGASISSTAASSKSGWKWPSRNNATIGSLEPRVSKSEVSIRLQTSGSRLQSHMVSDFRQAARTLSKSLGFSALVVAVFAVGIGANTAIFSIVNGVLLKPLPFAGASRLVAVDTSIRNQPGNTSYPDFLDWHQQATSFDRLAAYAGAVVTLTGAGDAVGLSTAVVSPDLFAMLGVVPL